MDPVKILPTEVFETVLSYLDVNDLMACCLVSQKWNIAANNDSLWKELCLENDWSDCGSLKGYMNNFSFLTPDKVDAFNNMGDWKKHYVLKMQLQNNWRTGKITDCIIRPIGNDFNASITCVTSNRNILAFGFDNGAVKLFDLKNGGKLLVVKNGALIEPVDYVKLTKDYLVILQSNLFQMYMIRNDCTLDLYCAKIINVSPMINVDVPTLMQLDPEERTILVKENVDDYFNDRTILHINDNYLVVGQFYSRTVNVYSMKSDLIEPNIIFDLDIDLLRKFLFNVYNKNDVLYVLVGETSSPLPLEQGSFDSFNVYVHAYSLKSQNCLFVQKLMSYKEVFSGMPFCSVEANECYLLLRFEFNEFCLFERSTGKLLLNDHGIIFLNANSDCKLIGLTVDDSFQIIDPNTGDEYFCLTLEGSPIGMFSSVLITLCIEYNRDGVGSAEVEFWNMHNTVEKIDTSLKFPKISTVSLLHQDETKLIFYAKKDCCVVRTFVA